MHNFIIIVEERGRGRREREKTMFTHTYTCMLPREQLQKFNPQIRKKIPNCKIVVCKIQYVHV